MNTKMKVLFLNIYQDTTSRGAETFVKELSKRLSENNKVKIISGGDIIVPPRSKSRLSRPFLDRNGRAIAGFTLKKLPEIWKEKPDIIIPLNGGWQPAFIRILTWIRGSKMVISGQSGIGWDDLNNLWCFPNAFVALSTKAEQWAKKVPFAKIIKIPNGVDLTRFKVRDYRLRNKTKIILAVGAFTEQKRLNLTIDAAAKLKNVKLIIAGGGGELRDKIYDLGIKKLGKERFEVISVPFEKMPEVYGAADVFTLPSASSEAFGNVLVEAMASGLPVVATDDPVRREIVGEAGILVDPTDIDEYAKALQKAMNTNWENKPRTQAEKFDWDKITEKYEILFNSL